MNTETQDQFEQRFLDKVEFPMDRLNECWNWSASAQSRGYGMFSIKGSKKRVLAHRVAHELVNGLLDDDEVVLHTCDNPRCVSPFHLKKGSQADNLKDMKEKGRQSRGSNRPLAKLTDAKVLEIRKKYSEGALQRDLAQTFGVSDGVISQVVNRKIWSHVEKEN